MRFASVSTFDKEVTPTFLVFILAHVMNKGIDVIYLKKGGSN